MKPLEPGVGNKRIALIHKARVVVYGLLLIWIVDYFFLQDARLRPNQLAPPPLELATLVKDLQRHCAYLASPELKGRAPGTTGNVAAEKYLLDQFQQIGLTPVSKNGKRVQTISSFMVQISVSYTTCRLWQTTIFDTTR